MKIIITESQFEQIIPNSVRRRLSEISDVLYEMLNNTDIGEEAQEYPEDDYVDYVIEILLPEVIYDIDWSDVAEYEEIFKKLVGDKIRQFWKEQNQDSLNESDSDKLTYSNQYADLFFEYCLKNINKITEKLISEAYYEFMINDLNVVITIDDLINSNGQRTIGEYDDETLTLRIVLFDYFKKFLLPIDDLGELSNDEKNKISRGIYKVPSSGAVSTPVSEIEMTAQVLPMTKHVEKSENRIQNIQTDLDSTDLIPKAYKNYVPFGNFEDVLAIVNAHRFFPVFITGHSGNGKTMSIEQACAKSKRKFICVSMTPETDESDLLGNYVLINGNMEWRDGPVTTAARQGAVLCIDEIDYGAQNLSSLQRVLEGKPFLLKKKGEMITPAPGFTVFATANTKGQGSDDGKFIGTNILNEAFLERFPINYLEKNYEKYFINRIKDIRNFIN